MPCPLIWLGERFPDGLPLGARLADAAASVIVSCECGGFKPKRFTVVAFARHVLAHGGPAALAIRSRPFVRPSRSRSPRG